MQQLLDSPLGQTFRFLAFCPVHPDAPLDVLGVEAPEPTAAVTRAHVRCGDCGLPWTYTTTCTPMKDHTAERLGITARHPKMGVNP